MLENCVISILRFCFSTVRPFSLLFQTFVCSWRIVRRIKIITYNLQTLILQNCISSMMCYIHMISYSVFMDDILSSQSVLLNELRAGALVAVLFRRRHQLRNPLIVIPHFVILLPKPNTSAKSVPLSWQPIAIRSGSEDVFAILENSLIKTEATKAEPLI